MTTDADRVKPLEWRAGTRAGSYTAHGVGTFYAIDTDHEFAILAKSDSSSLSKSAHGTAEAAKAAAQADYASRVLAALAPAPQAADAAKGGWQPIETAPKDRTHLLLSWQPLGGLPEHVELGYWSEAKAGWVNTYGNAFSGLPDAWAPLAPFPAAAPLSVPEGWVLVPRRPTMEMMKAAHAHHEGEAYLPFSLYQAMIDAAPLPPSPVPVSECATEGCSNPATVRFERGGVGSTYCRSCYMRIQALPAAAQEGNGNV